MANMIGKEESYQAGIRETVMDEIEYDLYHGEDVLAQLTKIGVETKGYLNTMESITDLLARMDDRMVEAYHDTIFAEDPDDVDPAHPRYYST